MTDDLELSGELGSTLFSAGRDEWPSDEALSRTLVAVGAGAAVVTVATGAAGAGASVGTAAKGGAALVSFGSVMKWLGVGAMSGVVVAGVAQGITGSPRAPLEPTAVVAAPPAPVRAPAKAPLVPKAAPAAAPESTEETPEPAVTAHPTRREADDFIERRAPLAAEVALVDRARAALASGNAARALEELAGYETAFADPRLEPEVLYLRMEAHLALGSTARAKATAEQSLRQFPRGPHVSRARAVIDGQL